MEPFPGRIGNVSSIEWLSVDGHRYYFGFDHSLDLVVSPLIDSPSAMAEFAATYLAQREGRHDTAYWADMVRLSLEAPQLTTDDSDAEFTTEALRAAPLPDHLHYLLSAAAGWPSDWLEEPSIIAAAESVGIDVDDDELIESCQEIGGPAADRIVNRYLTSIAENLPGNWRTVFAPLFERLHRSS